MNTRMKQGLAAGLLVAALALVAWFAVDILKIRKQNLRTPVGEYMD